MQATKMSRSPRLFKSVRQLSQNLAPSFSPSHRPSSSLRPSRLIPRATYMVCCDAPSLRAADMHDDAIEENDRPHRCERPRAPSGGLRLQIVRNLRDQRGGDLDAVQLVDDILNVAGGHALGIEGEDFFVKARDAPLMLPDQLRLEGAVTIAWGGDSQLAEIALHRLPRVAVPTVRRTFAGLRRRRRGAAFDARLVQRLLPFAATAHAYAPSEHPARC